MPKIARVQLADGRIARLEVPDDYTPAQAMAAAKQFATPAPAKPRNRGTGIPLIDDTLSSLNEVLIGGIEGLYNAASAVTDPIARKGIELVSGKDAADRALAGANRQRRAVSDAASRAFVSRPNPIARTVGRIGGTLAIPLPGKKLQEGGRIAKAAYRAMQGAVGGAGVREVDEGAAAPAAIGAAANVVLPPVIGAVAKPLAKAARPITNWLTASAGETAAALSPGRSLAPLGPRAEARAARFQKLGINKPTTGMVTRDPNSFAFERNTQGVQGVGDELQDQIRNVETGLIEKGREIVRSAGGAKGAESTGAAVQKALDAKRGEMQQVTGRLYDKVREVRGGEPVGALPNLRGVMDDADMTDNAVFDQMRESLDRRMGRLGEGVTVKQAEELRKFIRGLGSTADPSVRMMRGRLVDALDDDVVEAVGDDAFKAARASAKARFDEFSKTFAGRIADEGIAPERLSKRVLSDTTSLADLRAMRQSLLSGTDEQVSRGKEAWRGLKAQALDDLLSRSMNDEGKVLGGQLGRDFMKQAAKLRELLDPAEYKELRRLVLASRDATVPPPNSAVNYSGTAPALANMFQATKPKVQEGWIKFIGKMGVKHLGAFATAGPMGNVGVVVGENITGTIAQRKAAQALARRVQLAQSPEATAQAVAAMRQAAKTNPAAAGLLDRLGPAIGGTTAAAQ